MLDLNILCKSWTQRANNSAAAESCNWNGFIDIKASQWKIGLYTGRAGGDRIFEYLNLNNKMQRNFSYNHFDRHATKFSDISDLMNLQMNFPKFPV